MIMDKKTPKPHNNVVISDDSHDDQGHEAAHPMSRFEDIASRIRHAALNLGLVAQRSSETGVDVGALGEGANVSREMARRWVIGDSKPTDKNLENLARFLKVTPDWLLVGYDNSVDENTLCEVVVIVGEVLGRKGIELDPKSYARLVATIYDQLQKGENVTAKEVERYTNLLA